MQIGTVVRYRKEYPDGMKIDWVGIITKQTPMRLKFLVQWSSGVLDWRHPRELEVICE